ncbi:MAG TPA: type I polyketide synthase [Ktedonobacteraceae bacterium]|jgi:acyl transferase domain-containing protein
METFEHALAIIAMAGRFPGASTLEQFWQNLCAGRETITRFSDATLLEAGVNPALLHHPHYVKARGMLEDIELFDASFFGFTPREAEILDPQQRLFLECAWEVLERAGYTPERWAGRIGVFAGASMSSYLLFHLYTNQELVEAQGGFQLLIGNEKDFLPTRVSYKLNLTGPSINVNTTCSTSLVAVHLAGQSLLSGECDLALAGGVSITATRASGYLYQEGGIASPDGHCRAFDRRAAGTVDGNGVGIVALKRLADALADGDSIQAVITGSAINNDGAFKIGYTAPGVRGQAGVIAEALALSGCDPESIAYIEAHGTGTALGDPIEVAALSQVFRAHTSRRGFCALGSVKTNIGHLGAAAGVAGLIKTVLALQQQQIPPSLHFEQPNPQIDFAHSPFYVNTSLAAWPARQGAPRRAGVSSFGLGGTNAHLLLEEAPPRAPADPARPWHLLTLSAPTASALERASAHLAAHLRQHPEQALPDVAYTLQIGRHTFAHRRLLLCQEREEAIRALSAGDSRRVLTRVQERDGRPVVFLFPGQGAQYVQMAEELYRWEPLFREQVDRCAALLIDPLQLDLRTVLYPPARQAQAAQAQLRQTWLAQPALFVVEYALAQLWRAWGLLPEAMLGHSIGEYVAACLAGVFSLEDALTLVAARGRLMQGLPAGAMLSVALGEQELLPLLTGDLSLAACNGPAYCVVAGTAGAIADLQAGLLARGLDCQQLQTSHAFHSHLLDPILPAFRQLVASVRLKAPALPYLSNVSGTWITAAQASDPAYWVSQLRQPVRFARGVRELLREPERILLEVGPGHTLSELVRQQAGRATDVLTCLRHPREGDSDEALLLNTAGQLWLAGAPLDWRGLYTHERRQRLPLPTYPFERQRYWIDPPGRERPAAPARQPASGSFSLLASPAQGSAAPGTAIERAIADIWQEVLGQRPPGIEENFFALGGQSLQATRVATRLRDTFQVEFSLPTFFASPTVAGLARTIERRLLERIEALSEDEAEQLL